MPLSVGRKFALRFIIPTYTKYNCIDSLSKERERSSSITFKTWVRFPSAPPRDYMISDRLSILERKPSSLRMAARDNAGKKSKKTKRKHYAEHYRKDWDKDLWD